MKEPDLRDIGLNLRAVRDRLGLTLDALSKETGISRSYISEFERGVKLPTSRYLKHLHDRYNVNLNYIFCSDDRMFRPSQEEQARFNFGKFQEEIEEILECITKNPHALYSLLLMFSEYKEKNQQIIAQSLKEKSKNV
jgi:transcriptional regulator with XRE-family HTH domain